MTAMGADENFEMRAVLQALVLAAFSPPRTPQTACPFVLNQPHKGLRDSETSRATAAIRLCPQLRGNSGLHGHCWTPPARRSPGARVGLGSFRCPPGRAQVWSSSPHPRIFSSPLTPRGAHTVPPVFGNQPPHFLVFSEQMVLG